MCDGVRRHYIQFSVAIEICQRHTPRLLPGVLCGLAGVRGRARGELPARLESAVAITQKNRYKVVIGVNVDDIRNAIVVHIANSHRYRKVQRRYGCRRLEGSVALTQEKANVIRNRVSNSDIQLAVAVEIANNNAGRKDVG